MTAELFDTLLIAVVLLVGIAIGYRLRAADLAAWARQSARRDLQRRGLAVPASSDPLTRADYAWLSAQGIDSSEHERRVR